MENRFKVIYTGELQPYVSAQEAIRNVASMFKMSEDRVRALVLSGRAQEIKVNLDAVTAERYVSALSKAGLSVRVEPMGGTEGRTCSSTVTLAEAEAVARETPTETCPSAGPRGCATASAWTAVSSPPSIGRGRPPPSRGDGPGPTPTRPRCRS